MIGRSRLSSQFPTRAPGRTSARLALVILATLSFTPSLLFADRVTLANGRVIEGSVAERDGRVVITIDNGSKIVLDKSQVVSIEKAPLPADLLREKETALKPGDGAALARLARWCDENGLDDDRDRLYWRVLELRPNHVTARETLGFRKLGALWLTEADYQHHLGNVEYQGKWVPAAEWERLALAEADLLERAAVTDALRTAANSRTPAQQKEAAAALIEFRAAPESLRRVTLAQNLKSPKPRLRQLAVRLTGELDGRKPIQSLTAVAVTDTRKPVRDEALRVLKSWNDPDTALGFIPYLESKNDRQRVNATRALNVFPDRRAVPSLVTTTRTIWAGFGRSHFAQLVQRAYVKDYELVSGGTGLVVSEVADPVIDTNLTGVVLDIDVRRAEAVSSIATLERITGQRFGADFDAWAQWWEEEQGKPATAAATADGSGSTANEGR